MVTVTALADKSWNQWHNFQKLFNMLVPDQLVCMKNDCFYIIGLQKCNPKAHFITFFSLAGEVSCFCVELATLCAMLCSPFWLWDRDCKTEREERGRGWDKDRRTDKAIREILSVESLRQRWRERRKKRRDCCLDTLPFVPCWTQLSAICLFWYSFLGWEKSLLFLCMKSVLSSTACLFRLPAFSAVFLKHLFTDWLWAEG